MDSLKSLLDQKKYDLVVKLTETSTSSNDLFYRISALIYLGKYEDALYVIQDHQKTLESNLVALINAHINLLCVLNRFDQAHAALDYYSNLPYQSQGVEETLRKMPSVIEAEEKRLNVRKQYEPEDILKLLKSSQYEEVLLGLDLVKDRDVLEYLPVLKNLLLNHPKEVVKSYILMMLVKKEIDRELQVKKNDEVISINPKKLDAPFTGEVFNGVIRYFDSELKDLSLSQTATQLLSEYCIYIYPSKLDRPIKLYALAFKHIAEEYLNITPDDSEIMSLSMELNIQEEEIKDFIEKIKKILLDF